MSEPSDKSTIPTRSKAIRFIFDNSLLLLAGTAAGVVWANLDVASYDASRTRCTSGSTTSGWCSSLPSQRRKCLRRHCRADPWRRLAVPPLAAAVGGMVAPALIYVALASTRGADELIRGWAIPCATDIAFSAMVVILAVFYHGR
jgi:Na+:H+ antiporter, NhaA family